MDRPTVPAHLGFRVNVHTRWSDEDTQAVLNNAVYVTLLEEGRHRYFAALDLLEENRFPFVLLQTNVRFLAPGRGGNDVEVALSTTHLGKSSFQQAYRLTEAESGTVLCEAEAILVAWDPGTRGSRPLDPDFRARVEAFEANAKRDPA